MKRALFALALVVGCSEDATDVPPLTPSPPEEDGGAHAKEPTDAGGGATPIDAATAGSATTYIGTLSETPATQFGGGPNHCTYEVTLKNVSIEIDVNAAGDIIGGAVQDLMVETVIGSCAFLAQPDSQQSFSLSTATGTTLAWAGAGGNRPQTGLTIDVTKTGASYQAAATWTRTDESDDLKWVVETQITLGPR